MKGQNALFYTALRQGRKNGKKCRSGIWLATGVLDGREERTRGSREQTRVRLLGAFNTDWGARLKKDSCAESSAEREAG